MQVAVTGVRDVGDQLRAARSALDPGQHLRHLARGTQTSSVSTGAQPLERRVREPASREQRVPRPASVTMLPPRSLRRPGRPRSSVPSPAAGPGRVAAASSRTWRPRSDPGASSRPPPSGSGVHQLQRRRHHAGRATAATASPAVTGCEEADHGGRPGPLAAAAAR